MTFKELSEWYLNLYKVKALSSYWLIKLSLDKFNSVFAEMVVTQIKPADLEEYQAKRKKEGKADATIDHEIRVVLFFMICAIPLTQICAKQVCLSQS